MNEWRQAALGEVCDFKGGSQPPKSNFIYEPRSGYVRFLQIRDFSSDKNHTYIPISKKNNICETDDIMIGRYGASVGKILTGKAGAYNVALMKATPNTNFLTRQWLFHYLTSPLFQTSLMNVAQRSAQDGFSKDDIYNFQIPLPPLSVQKAIVTKLDAVFASIDTAIAAAERNAENAKQLFQSHLNDVFENKGSRRSDKGAVVMAAWKMEKLVNLCTVFADGDWIETKDQSDTGIRLVQTGNVGIGKFKDRAEKARYISSDTFKRLRCTEILEGDILVSRLPDPVGRACIIPKLDEQCITAVDCTIIRLNTANILPEFITYYFQSPSYFKDVQNKVTGATRQRISRKSLGLIEIPLPPLPVQKAIVAKLDDIAVQITKLGEICTSKRKSFLALKQSLLQQAFSGQLVDA